LPAIRHDWMFASRRGRRMRGMDGTGLEAEKSSAALSISAFPVRLRSDKRRRRRPHGKDIAMTTTQLTTTLAHSDNARSRQGVWRVGAVAGVGAAVANFAIAIVARAADIPLELGGEAIPALGFAQVTLMCAVLGIGLAAVFARTSRHARRAFTVTATALTVASLVPPLLVDASTATRLVLELTHLVAAVIVVPTLASRLNR
jgi:hypothetical protein